MAIVVDNELPQKLSHNHFLYLNTADTSGAVLVSIQLTGSENYSVWSRSMRIAILGRNKLGFIDGRCRKENFGPNLSDLWERCNAIVLSWIMNCVSKELLSGIVYSSDVCAVWNDLKERFDKADGSRIFQLHREIATMSQGTSSISEYFTRLRLRWAEFDSLALFPDCNCAGSRGFRDFMNRQKLLQFLMGLNESYEQARGHILMLILIPSVNQAYSMMIERESQRNMTNVTSQAMNMEIAAFSSGRGTHNNNKPKKNWNVQCDHCKIMGHVKSDCYRLIGYPPDFKFKKKFGNPNAPNVHGGDQRSQANFVRNDDAWPNRAAYTDSHRDLQNNGKSAMVIDNHKDDGFSNGSSGDWYRGPGSSNFTQTQYNQMVQHMDNPNHYEQFQRITDREKVGEPSANMSSMGGNAFASILPATDNAGNASTPFMSRSEKNWIIDTGASNHMIFDKDMLNSKETINVSVNAKKVHLPNGGTVNVSHIGNCDIMDGKS